DAGSQRGLIEIVDIEVLQPVVTLEGTEVLQMEIPCVPRQGRAIERVSCRPIFPEEVAGSAEERKRALRHRLVLQPQPIVIATLVERQYPARNRGSPHS